MILLIFLGLIAFGLVVYIVFGITSINQKKDKKNLAVKVYRLILRSTPASHIRQQLMEDGYSQTQINHAFIRANHEIENRKRSSDQ